MFILVLSSADFFQILFQEHVYNCVKQVGFRFGEQNATDYIFCCFLRHFLPHQLCKQEHETEFGRYHSFNPQTLVPMRRLARTFIARLHSWRLSKIFENFFFWKTWPLLCHLLIIFANTGPSGEAEPVTPRSKVEHPIIVPTFGKQFKMSVDMPHITWHFIRVYAVC